MTGTLLIQAFIIEISHPIVKSLWMSVCFTEHREPHGTQSRDYCGSKAGTDANSSATAAPIQSNRNN